MRKPLLKVLSAGALLLTTFAASAQTPYLDEMYANVLKQSNVVYDSNRSVNILFGQVPGAQPIIGVNLTCDIYTPVGAATTRPTVIIAHTGSFLPILTNKQATGNKNDSAVVAICTALAKRGYNAVAVNYRLGWNALSTVQADATEQLLKATYRGIQDIRNCIRFLRTNASTYGVDTSKIIVGGQGTGGYVALALATVDKRAEIENIAKFQRSDFSPMVSVDTLGDWNGLGGNPFFVVSGESNVSGNAHMVFNYGGAMGDLSWLEANSLPIVGMQVATDPFAPYNTGNVIVPTTGTTVIPSASGAGAVVPKANNVGANAKLNTKFLVDPVSVVGRTRTSGVANLYPFFPPTQLDGAPWEWWSRSDVQSKTFTFFYSQAIPANGREADSLSMLTNPTMSEAKARAYIDTIVKFVTPRIALQFDLVAASQDQFRSGFGLLSPANNSSVLIKGDSIDKVNITWEIANTSGFGNMTYNWKLTSAASPNFATPIISVATPTPDLSLTYKTVSGLLGSQGVAIGDSVDLKWTVEADLNGNKLWASDTFNLRLTRGQVTALNEANVSQHLSVFPNPASSVLNINLNSKAGVASSYSLVDITGRTVMTGNADNSFSLNVNDVNPGLYFVQITLKDGNVATKRVVIE